MEDVANFSHTYLMTLFIVNRVAFNSDKPVIPNYFIHDLFLGFRATTVYFLPSFWGFFVKKTNGDKSIERYFRSKLHWNKKRLTTGFNVP